MMTVQEFAQKYKAEYPQFSHIDDLELAQDVARDNPSIAGKIDFQGKTRKAQPISTPIKQEQVKTEQPKEESNLDYLTGAAKSLGRSILDVAELGVNTSKKLADLSPAKKYIEEKIPAIKMANEYISQKEEQGLNYLNKKLEPKNTKEKVGGYAETAAELLLPAKALSLGAKALKSEKALTMSLPELKMLSEGKFQRIFGMNKSELDTVGGLIGKQVKKMPEKLNELQAQFKNILTGNITKDMANVKQAKTDLWNKTLDLIKGNDQAINMNQLRAGIKKKIEEGMVLGQNKAEILDKTIEPFMKKVESGTLSGVEKARGALSLSGRKSSGELNQASEILHKAVKEFVRSKLPETKRATYDALKQEHAKLFDVLDILKAKNSPTLLSGKSKLVEGTKTAAKVLGGTVAGSWLYNKLR